MKTLQECKDEVARDHSFTDWPHLLKAHSGKIDHYITLTTELYAASHRTVSPEPDVIYTLNDMFEFAKMCGNVSGDGYYKMQFKEWIKTRKPIIPDIGK